MRSLLDGGPFVWLLLALSVTALTVVLERAWSLRRDRVMPRPLLDALAGGVGGQGGPGGIGGIGGPGSPGGIGGIGGIGDLARLRGACAAQPSPLSRLVDSVLDHLPWPKSENVAALEVRARQEIAGLERGLVVLEVIVGIAPLLGLVGTIYGIIPLLGDFGSNLQADNAFIARGMSVALYKTVLGLLVAMPSLAAWSFFTKRVELLGLELEAVCDGLLRRHYLRSGAEGAAGAGADGGGQRP
ncbi:MAG: MotA/TolQ/ExbB proton channel family protein [Verrucomicrobia bacterium]|nr:MotA/TolQ/ExbB proton channel family protein [Verrucomicrobiota bacterium]